MKAMKKLKKNSKNKKEKQCFVFFRKFCKYDIKYSNEQHTLTPIHIIQTDFNIKKCDPTFSIK